MARTSLVAKLMPRLATVHRRQRIGVFAGPPGLGKTTTVRHFAAENVEETFIITVPPMSGSGMRETSALQLLLDGIHDFNEVFDRSSYLHSVVDLRRRLYSSLNDCAAKRAYQNHFEYKPHLTVIVDEAQGLSAGAIESLRFLNDAGSGFSPFPVGLAFVGNAEFRLKSNKHGQSILTDAVRDRALYTDVFTSDDIADDDLILLMDARGITDPECHRLVVRYFKAGRVDRSLRQLENLMDELEEEAGAGSVTAETVRFVIGLV